jgi:hypothetical protein
MGPARPLRCELDFLLEQFRDRRLHGDASRCDHADDKGSRLARPFSRGNQIHRQNSDQKLCWHDGALDISENRPKVRIGPSLGKILDRPTSHHQGCRLS